MPRRSAFAFETLDIHLQRPLRHAFPVVIDPSACDLSLSARLDALKRIFDKANRDQVTEAA